MIRCRWPVAAVLMLALGCSPAVDPGQLRLGLDAMVAQDLKDLASELAPGNALDSVYAVVQEFEASARTRYLARAVVDLHFLKGDVAKMVSKYRYRTRTRAWECYHREYRLLTDGHAPHGSS